MKILQPRVRHRTAHFLQDCLKHIKTKEAAKKLARSASFFVIASVLLLVNAAPAAAMFDANVQDKRVEGTIKEVEGFVEGIADKDLDHKKNDFKRELRGALGWGWFWGGHWKSCKTVQAITRLMERIDWLRQSNPSEALDELYVKLWTLRNDILQSLPPEKPCRGFENVGKEPKVTIGQSDNTQVAFGVDFAPATMTLAKGNNQTFAQIHVSGVEGMVGEAGQPAIPMWRKLIAVPQGSTARLVEQRATSSQTVHLNLVPFQPQPVDEKDPQTGEGEGEPTEPSNDTFADKPFAINEETYRTDRTLHATPCKITPMGQYRDVQMVQLECATGSYNPVSDELKLHQGLSVQVAFEGENTNFITDRTFSPFESAASLTTEAALNKDVLSRYVKHVDIGPLQCLGEELLILTHTNFREAADRLATHKRNKGITTNVFNVGSGVASRDTAEEIDDFIEDRYDDCKVRPSYVMLMGDAEFIPTFYPAGMPENTGSDFPYSNYVQILFDVFFPDFGTGRVPVDTLGQANTVVDKIINYESDPPHLGLGNGGPFYTTVGLASQFQCCRMNANGTPLNGQPGTDQRAFIETSELVRQELVDRGYTVPRIYTRTVDDGGYCIQENANGDCIQTQAPYNGDSTPRRYRNGSLLPAAIGAGSGFAWNGSTANISSAWNEGRFLFVHRDHGWPGGWGSPGFSSGNVDALTNGELQPVVWSVNCASGIFDNETAGGVYNTTTSGVYFAERALRKADGGAIGVIGDTRNSPTWANNALTRGFFDAVWPDTVPTHGGNSSHKRLGDILNWGKVYLASQVGVGQTAGSISIDDMAYEYSIWHVIGDPTLEMWTKNPHKLVLSNKFSAQISHVGETIRYEGDGTTLTKLQIMPDGEVRSVGRAVVSNGQAEMTYFQQPDPQLPSIYVASKADAVSTLLQPGHTDPVAGN